MEGKWFECPNCNANLREKLLEFFWQEAIHFDSGGNEFEYECPNCEVWLKVTNQPDPMLFCEL